MVGVDRLLEERDERLCRLLECILSGGTLTPQLEKKLLAQGWNIKSLRKCLRNWCRSKKSRKE